MRLGRGVAELADPGAAKAAVGVEGEGMTLEAGVRA